MREPCSSRRSSRGRCDFKPILTRTSRASSRQWEPWAKEIYFSNGVKTSCLQTTVCLQKRPLEKWKQFESLIPAEAISGGTALDIRYNAGLYSIMLHCKYDMEVTGIEMMNGIVKR